MPYQSTDEPLFDILDELTVIAPEGMVRYAFVN